MDFKRKINLIWSIITGNFQVINIDMQYVEKYERIQQFGRQKEENVKHELYRDLTNDSYGFKYFMSGMKIVSNANSEGIRHDGRVTIIL